MCKRVFFFIFALLFSSSISFAQILFEKSEEGWLYIYEGDVNNYTPGNKIDIVATHLDGTWEDGDDWDLSGIGPADGILGGVDLLENEDVSFLRIQDPGDPRDFPDLVPYDEHTNRKIQFYHALTQEGVPEDGRILDEGITLAFRIKVPVREGIGEIDSIFRAGKFFDDGREGEIWAYPEEGNGYLPYLGHGMVSIHQTDGMNPDDPRSIGFSLMTTFDHDTIATTGEGLYMNSNYGHVPLSRPNPFWDNEPYPELAVNHINCNPREWNEFWVQIVKDSTSAATHFVKIWMNGDIDSPYEFLVTASVRSWRDMPHMYMGFITNQYSGAVDIDYYGVQLGLIDPIVPCKGACYEDALCLGDTLDVFYTYEISENTKLEWDFEGASFVDTTDTRNAKVSWEENGYKTISLIVREGEGITYSKTDSVLVNNTYPTASILTDDPQQCGKEEIQISYTGSALPDASYIWNFDGGNIISGKKAGPYKISWANAGQKSISLTVQDKGCSTDTSMILEVNSPPQPIPLCMVSVDSANHNSVIWDQPTGNNYVAANIYRQTSQADVYEKIGTQPVDKPSVFIDTLSNPVQSSDRYKIAAVDTNGCESALSDFHKTLHLTINTGIHGSWNLIWDDYKGFNYGTYSIYRGSTKDNLLKIAEQASNTFSYTDQFPPVGTVYYQLGIISPSPCKPGNLKSSEGDYSTVMSNMVSSDQVNSTESISTNQFIIWPNPANDLLHIYLKVNMGEAEISILSMDGKLLQKIQTDEMNPEVDISYLKSGMYLIRVNTQDQTFNKAFLKR